MNKFVIQSREDIFTLRDIFERNDIRVQLSNLFDENGEEVGMSLKIGDKIYFWNIGEDNA